MRISDWSSDVCSSDLKFFNTTKGFGFIARDDGQADAFVHISAVQRAGMAGLDEGDRVAFDIEVDDRGKFAAVNIQPHQDRSEEHTSELQSLMRISYAVFCLKKKTNTHTRNHQISTLYERSN